MAGAASRFVKDHVRRLFEHDRHIGHPFRQPFAGPNIERHARPPPIVDRQLQRHIGLRPGTGCDPALLKISRHRLSPQRSRDILSAHHPTGHLVGRGQAQRLEHLDFLVPDRRRLERRRRLHGDQCEHLENVRLDHVSHDPRPIEIPGPRTHAQRFRHRNLHVVDIPTIPERLEDRVSQSKYQDILHRLFPQIMIDPVHLPLGEGRVNRPVQLPRRRRIPPERFLDHDPRPVQTVRYRRYQGTVMQITDNLGERIRRRRQVVQRVVRHLPVKTERFQTVPQPAVSAFIFEWPRHIMQVAQERLQLLFGLGGSPRMFAHRLRHLGTKLLVALFAPGVPDNRELLRDVTVDEQIEEGRDQFPLGQVAGSAEDHQLKRPGVPHPKKLARERIAE